MLNNLSGTDLAIILVSIIISMTIHEVMHGFVAHLLGDTTAKDAGRLTLNPLKHIDLYTTIILPMVLIALGVFPIFAAKPVPFNPDRVKHEEYGVALVGIAGPLTNLFLAILAGIIFRIFGIGLGEFMYNAVQLFAFVNVAFFIFNMIPFPPLDGSRLLYAFAPEPVQEVMMRIESMGFISVLIFIFIIFEFASGLITNVEQSLLNFIL
jgi:Zn-dependent protease